MVDINALIESLLDYKIFGTEIKPDIVNTIVDILNNIKENNMINGKELIDKVYFGELTDKYNHKYGVVKVSDVTDMMNSETEDN